MQMLGPNPTNTEASGLEWGLDRCLFTKPHRCFYRDLRLRITDLTQIMKNLGISYTLKEQWKEPKSPHKFYMGESFEIKGDPVSSLRGCYLGHPNIQIWASQKEKAGNKQPLEHGAKWNYGKLICKMLWGLEGPILFSRDFCNRKQSSGNASIFEFICISFR